MQRDVCELTIYILYIFVTLAPHEKKSAFIIIKFTLHIKKKHSRIHTEFLKFKTHKSSW